MFRAPQGGSNPSFCATLVRKPILNKIIKIGSRTVCFSLIFRAFFDLPVSGTKEKLLKTEEEKI
jgi:hypothetical protein